MSKCLLFVFTFFLHKTLFYQRFIEVKVADEYFDHFPVPFKIFIPDNKACQTGVEWHDDFIAVTVYCILTNGAFYNLGIISNTGTELNGTAGYSLS